MGGGRLVRRGHCAWHGSLHCGSTKWLYAFKNNFPILYSDILKIYQQNFFFWSFSSNHSNVVLGSLKYVLNDALVVLPSAFSMLTIFHLCYLFTHSALFQWSPQLLGHATQSDGGTRPQHSAFTGHRAAAQADKWSIRSIGRRDVATMIDKS